ncbi:mitochondrial ribosomal protein L42 [Culex quinquefasciatus]|uniref:Large ribosomal subunit protein mL42 n=1 Tax=Culex quinquefasciatus TaxID=7176 RepID=B0W3P7_CULQU|nr:39S ribosomal protein L42, mitochondrial [Culex quinquefasciatus]EDS32194.1 mitochondrial ribosomal protein L42 [Culex quinquefasciatus]|eukprot:XP_001843331.1 mitochondrial ribosomal protein L42 [Culex quinquefasciatus]
MALCVRVFRRWNHFKTLKQYENVPIAPGCPQSLVQQVIPVGEKCYLAWHPQPQFPYEHSKPIVRNSVESGSNLINDELVCSGASGLKDKHPEFVRDELAKATFTTKHRWFPRARDKKAKRTPMDREFL